MTFYREIRRFWPAVLVFGALLNACDQALQLTPATVTNVADTVTMYALRGTNVTLPSGFDIPSNGPARTDNAAFDFAFDVDQSGNPLLYPAGALGLTRAPGIMITGNEFDSLKVAPTTGYNDSTSVGVTPGIVFLVKSRPYIVGCELTGELPRYGKFRVLSVDPALRSVTLETLVNQNCGYRSLEPGLPTI